MKIESLNILKYSAVSVAFVTTITMSGCSAATVSAPEQAKTKITKTEIMYNCVTFKDEKFNVKVVKEGNICGVTVDGKNEIIIDSMNPDSAFYYIAEEIPTGVNNGKEYYTIGLSTCTKAN
jgi:hypothetical protein